MTPMHPRESSDVEQRPSAPIPYLGGRARLILDFSEGDEHTHSAETGFAKVDGLWVLWFSDEDECWQSWPIYNVVCIDWECGE